MSLARLMSPMDERFNVIKSGMLLNTEIEGSTPLRLLETSTMDSSRGGPAIFDKTRPALLSVHVTTR